MTISLAEAKADPKKRQRFLSDYLEAHPHDAVEALLDDTDAAQSQKKLTLLYLEGKINQEALDHYTALMRVNPSRDLTRHFQNIYDIGRGFSQEIYVTSHGWDEFKEQGDFELTIDLEYERCRIRKDGWDLGDGLMLDATTIHEVSRKNHGRMERLYLLCRQLIHGAQRGETDLHVLRQDAIPNYLATRVSFQQIISLNDTELKLMKRVFNLYGSDSKIVEVLAPYIERK